MSQSDNWPNGEDTNSQSPQSLTSQSEEDKPATPAPRSRLRPAGKRPVSLPSVNLVSDTKRVARSELDIVTSVRVFWKDVLKGKLDKAIEKTKKTCEAGSTEVILSTTHHGTKNVTLSFDALSIDWRAIDTQLKEWNSLPTKRKKRNVVTISITFDHTVIEAKKELTQQPLPLNYTTYERVLADERLRVENEEKQRMKDQQRKRKRHDSESVSSGPCHGQPCPLGGRPTTPEVVFPTSPLIALLEPRRDFLRAYDVWQIHQASDDEKESYKRIEQLNLERKYDLGMIVSNQPRAFQYYMENDVPEGVAWHYVCDIKGFYKLRKEQHAKNA
ncbi:hypothetical protein X797_011592 [Metarhizium robertsii]|uniref:C-myc binding protein n=2 Tax=Metarhizium robertsii TaxID=568076 RepID=A0A0B2X707_METRA|nr:c-myc binding protein [Metarhizium robertsii ARSEF 23]EXU95344.1 hypothetical protein X797_011592 [Metarhizium robertsii]KHO10658.1 c-myc binding protein [Metarhizium robertsii ARSEF 23]